MPYRSGRDNAFGRKIKIRSYLLARRAPVELGELREVFGISEKTLKADLRDIQDSGVQFEKLLVERRAAVQVSSAHAFNETALSQWETWAVIAATAKLKHHPPTYRAAHGARKKVTDAMPRKERTQAETMGKLIHCLHHGGIKVYREDKDSVLDALFQAALNRWMIRYVYETTSGAVRRGHFAPYCFVEYNQGFYVHGRVLRRPEDGLTPETTPGMPQTWPYERFQEVEVLRDHRVRIADGFKPEDCADSFGLFSRASDEQCVIECQPAILPYIRERVWHPTQQLSAPDEHGRVRLSFRSRALPDVARWVQSWQGAAVPIEPPELVRAVYGAMTRGAQRIRELHGDEAVAAMVAEAERPRPRRKAKRKPADAADAADAALAESP